MTSTAPAPTPTRTARSSAALRRIAATAAAAVTGAGLLAGCLAPGTPDGWSSYTIAKGGHAAQVDRPQGATGPIAGLVSPGRDRRSYQLTLTANAAYVITDPAQPEDQYDWNKLPGYSDCGDFDLSRNGAMFGWRWRTDTTPKVLEITAYANNNSTHLWSDTPLATLSAADLAAAQPLTYTVTNSGDEYRFTVTGTIRGRRIDATATLPRACPTSPATTPKWYSGLYFGGTSVSPQEIYAYIRET